MFFKKIIPSFRRLQWKLTFSYTAVTVGSLFVVLLMQVYLNLPELPGALEDIGVKHLTQVDVPGSADVSFPKEGAYAVYAVGPNMIWGFLNIVLKPIALIPGGTFVFVFACGISLLIISIVAFKRHQSKKSLASQA